MFSHLRDWLFVSIYQKAIAQTLDSSLDKTRHLKTFLTFRMNGESNLQ